MGSFIPRPKYKSAIKITEEYYKQIRNECVDFVPHNIDVTIIDKVLKNLMLPRHLD